MIEVRLTREEQPHPAMDNPTGWFGKRGDFWRMESIESMTDEQHRTLYDAIREFLLLADEHYGERISQMVKDIEVCGSYAFGNFRWFSDMDIQLTTEDEKMQPKLVEIFLRDRGWFKESTSDLSRRLKLHLDSNFWTPDNKEYNEVYSLRDRKLYNKPNGKAKDQLFHRKYDWNTKRYEVITRAHPSKFVSIYWDDDGNLLDRRNNGDN